MPERILDQNDPNIDTIADLQRSIAATLTYLMGRASVAELFGLQAYLSQLASGMADVVAGKVRHGPQAPWDEALWQKYNQEDLRQQLAEMERQNQRLRAQQDLSNRTPAQHLQEG
jgi:HAMP domain-containing protein